MIPAINPLIPRNRSCEATDIAAAFSATITEELNSSPNFAHSNLTDFRIKVYTSS